jgi:hypothetical protein
VRILFFQSFNSFLRTLSQVFDDVFSVLRDHPFLGFRKKLFGELPVRSDDGFDRAILKNLGHDFELKLGEDGRKDKICVL